MALDDIRLLLVRPQDLLVVSVRLVGFSVDGGTAVSAGPGGLVELTFPPQATGELPYDPGVGLAGARLGGSSRVSLQVTAATAVPLTAEGILALAMSARPISGTDPPGQEPTAVELPWRLRFGPRPQADGDALLGTFPSTPLLGAGGAAGLWHLRLEAASGLGLVPLQGDADDVDADGQPFSPPLHRGHRDRIRAEGSPPQLPPTTAYLDLSALGGTMSAKGTWPTFSWAQDVVLGRDMVVKVESKGFLYPWGHRATLVEATRRVLVPETGPATAGLQSLKLLVVPDPVRHRAADGPLSRGLPFDEVEVLQPWTEVGADEVPEVFQRVPKRLEQLEADLTAKNNERDAQNAVVDGLPATRVDEINGFIDSQESGPNERLAQITPLIDELTAIDKAFQDFAATHPPPAVDHSPVEIEVEDEFGHVTVDTGTPATEDPGPPGLTSDQAAQLVALSNEAAALSAQLEQLEAQRQALLDVPRDVESLLALGGGYADAINLARRLTAEASELDAHVTSVKNEAAQELHVFLWPHATTGERLMLPVRCDALRVVSPVLFVHDVHFDENDDFPEFAPLADSEVLDRIDTTWQDNEARRMPVPGITVDLVRTGPAQPADALPVHEISVVGRRDGGEFRAVVEDARVALKAVGELVPGVDGLARVHYDQSFLEDGSAEHVALRLAEALPVDFRQAADKSGGLVSPSFAADVLSRSLGPVDGRALPGFHPGTPDLAGAFADATVLGIPLASIVDDVSLPQPMSIVTEPDGGARMSWTDIVLRSHGPFVVTPRTTFAMTVVRSPAETRTTCRIEDFALVLPPGGDLVRLVFKALTFLQEPGRPPDLQVDGFHFEIGGDLGLLKTLQEKFDFGAAAPTVRSTPTGMSAGYSLAVPEVVAGMFVLKNVSGSVSVDVPFDGRPIVTTLAFASRDNPFNLSVSVFGGGGYLVFEIAEEGIRKLEASLDFGASVAISVGVASAEVHALGGVSLVLAGHDVTITGFLRIGGGVDVLGLVSVSVELRVDLSYDDGVLSGEATAVIEIDVTFWSGSVTLDSGRYVFAGAEATGPTPPSAALQSHEPTLTDWQKYREKFGAA